MPNTPQFVMAYFAILKAGGVVVATNPLYSKREIEHQMNDSGVELMLVMREEKVEWKRGINIHSTSDCIVEAEKLFDDSETAKGLKKETMTDLTIRKNNIVSRIKKELENNKKKKK